KHLYFLSWQYINIGLYNTGLLYSYEAIELAEKNNFKKGISASYGNIGLFYKEQGDYPKALDFYFKALKIDEELGNKKGVGRHLGSIGSVYLIQGDNPKALEYYFKALEITEKFGDKNGTATKLANIGSVYMKQGEYSKALGYYLKSLKITEEIGSVNGISTQLGNVGTAYMVQGDYSKALDNYFKALKIAEELGDKIGILANLSNIGSLYTEQKKYKEAYDYLSRALVLSKNLGAKDMMKSDYERFSVLYENANIPLPDSIGNKLLNMEQMRLLSIKYYKRSIEIRDEIFSEESKKQLVRKEMNYEFEKKEEATKAEQDIKDALAMADKKKANLVLILISCLFVLVFVFAFFVFRSLGITRKQKGIIEKKSKLLEEKNKDITDSIHYAKRIQDALLRDEEHTSLHLPEHFILYIPKDIVSGDFYWGAEKQGYWFFAAVDCTGHGVPGAVMSMLGISFLNDIVSSEQLPSPAEVLNRLRERVVKELRQTGEVGGSKDGMDISIARLNLTTFELQWAGANNSLTLIRNGGLEEIKANKQPIGYHPENSPYTNHEIQLQKGDSIYIFSDGYADQFGGPKGKKLSQKKLKNLFMIHNYLSMKEQKTLLKKRFNEWKGSLEQVDDVCVFGVRV
ncbi:MAG: tetratricopeptide repeat protein, partial [Bacteroidetes bacterium]|nr:tetratricopeptide repeat protein [Bacteroidota bacterium]